jgi:hypothetical protein
MESQKKPIPPVVELLPDTHERLQRISQKLHRPVGQVVTDLVERYEREEFWREVNESVNRLREDPVAWKSYKDEIALLEGGSMDGLEQEEPWFTPEEEEEIRAEAARSRGG